MIKQSKTWQQLWIEHLCSNAKPLTARYWRVACPAVLGKI